MFRALLEKVKVFFVKKKSNNHSMIMDLTHPNLVFQINEAEGVLIPSENNLPKYEGPEDIASPREFIEIPKGDRDRKLFSRFNLEHISLNSDDKNSDLNLDLAEHAFRMDFELEKTNQNIVSASPNKPLDYKLIDSLQQSFCRPSP